MILTPVYCSSEPPPASGPVRSKMTPILFFLPGAWAAPATPSPAPATISPPSRRAAVRTSIKTSLEDCGLCLLVFVDAHHTGRVGRCQAGRFRVSRARLLGANPEPGNTAEPLGSCFANEPAQSAAR